MLYIKRSRGWTFKRCYWRRVSSTVLPPNLKVLLVGRRCRQIFWKSLYLSSSNARHWGSAHCENNVGNVRCFKFQHNIFLLLYTAVTIKRFFMIWWWSAACYLNSDMNIMALTKVPPSHSEWRFLQSLVGQWCFISKPPSKPNLMCMVVKFYTMPNPFFLLSRNYSIPKW